MSRIVRIALLVGLLLGATVTPGRAELAMTWPEVQVQGTVLAYSQQYGLLVSAPQGTVAVPVEVGRFEVFGAPFGLEGLWPGTPVTAFVPTNALVYVMTNRGLISTQAFAWQSVAVVNGRTSTRVVLQPRPVARVVSTPAYVTNAFAPAGTSFCPSYSYTSYEPAPVVAPAAVGVVDTGTFNIAFVDTAPTLLVSNFTPYGTAFVQPAVVPVSTASFRAGDVSLQFNQVAAVPQTTYFVGQPSYFISQPTYATSSTSLRFGDVNLSFVQAAPQPAFVPMNGFVYQPAFVSPAIVPTASTSLRVGGVNLAFQQTAAVPFYGFAPVQTSSVTTLRAGDVNLSLVQNQPVASYYGFNNVSTTSLSFGGVRLNFAQSQPVIN